MKRSEMICLINDYLMKEFCEGHPKDQNGAWDDFKSAENILGVIEEAGMLPPFDDKMHWSNWNITNGGHEWEKE